MTTLSQRRRTYDRLRLFFEMYDLPHCLAELERARRKTLEANSRRFVSARKGERKVPPVDPVVSYLGEMETIGGCSQATGARESANVRRAPAGRNGGGMSR